MKKLVQELDSKNIFEIMIAGGGIALIYMLASALPGVFAKLKIIMGYFNSFFVAVIAAYLLNPTVTFFREKVLVFMKNKKRANIVAVILTIVCFFGMIIILFYSLIPQFVESVTMIAKNAPEYYEKLSTTINSLPYSEFAQKTHLDVRIADMLRSAENIFYDISTWIMDNIANIAGRVAKMGSAVATVIVSIIATIYLMFDWENFVLNLHRTGRALFSGRRKEVIVKFLYKSDVIIKNYFVGNIIDAFIVGFANFFIMKILNMPNAVLISFVVAITNLVPTFGPAVGWVISVFLLALIDPWFIISFTVFTFIIQTLDANVVKPLVFKDAVGLPPLWILVSVIVGGKMAGVGGMLIAMPVAGIIAFVIEDQVARLLVEKGLDPTPISTSAKKRKILDIKYEDYFKKKKETVKK